jgi:hypothetical protein
MENGYRKVCLNSDSAVAIDLIENVCPQNHPCISIVSRINRIKMQRVGGVLSTYIQIGKPGR